MVIPAQASSAFVRTLYVMAFTPEALSDSDALKRLVHIADARLRAKDAAFKYYMEEGMAPTTRIEITNLQRVPLMHTPQGMQEVLAGWLKKRYAVSYQPVLGKSFFPHGMIDPQGHETYVLFYFDIEDKGETGRVSS